MDNLEMAVEPLVALARTHSALQQHELAEVRIGAERTVRVIESCIALIRAIKPSRVDAPNVGSAWAIIYEDPSHPMEYFVGENAEATARATHAARRPQWNCRLMTDADTRGGE